MSNLRLAAQQALEALESDPDEMVDRGDGHWDFKHDLAITALRAALAEPEQEPVAWIDPKWIDPDTRGWPSDSFESVPIEGWLPLYTAPTPRINELEALNAELGASLRVAVDSDLGAYWVWPESAKETWMQNARAALAKVEASNGS